MKIGILTQPLTTNYGGILQNYALQTVLKNLGHEPKTIDYIVYTWKDWYIYTLKNLIKKLLGRQCYFISTPSRELKKEIPLRRFVCNNISLTAPRKKSFTASLIEKYNFDAVVVGSDQVWRPSYNADRIEDMYLAFTQGLSVRRVAYAASFGTDEWEYTKESTNICSVLAKKIDAISVRELTGVELCKRYLGVTAAHVLDPTMLLTSLDYEMICKDIERREPFVFAYMLDISSEKRQIVESIAKSRGLTYIIVSAGNDISENDSIELWLSYFRDCSFVVTDSFHGTVFSIIFNRDFIVCDNQSRGNARFHSLLDIFDLQNRMIISDQELPPLSIDWDAVKVILNTRRIESIEWLNSALC